MTVRAWATLLIRGFALYNIISHGVYILWMLALRIISGPGGDSVYRDAYTGSTLAATLVYPAIWLAVCILLLIVSDGLIRWIARVPGESTEKAA